MGVRTSTYKFEGNTLQPIYDDVFQRLTSIPMDASGRQWLGEMFGQLISSFLIIKTKYFHHCILHSGVHVLNSKSRILLAGVLHLFLKYTFISTYFDPCDSHACGSTGAPGVWSRTIYSRDKGLYHLLNGLIYLVPPPPPRTSCPQAGLSHHREASIRPTFEGSSLSTFQGQIV